MQGGTLGPYRLDRELGAGGMGKVYAAEVAKRDFGLDTGTRVAVKVVHPHLLETPGFFRRFLREAEIGASIRHENVVATYGADAAAAAGVQHHYLVMEYVEGQTLRGLLDELERVPEELCRHIGREVAKGLAAIHAAGVVHRDMKPENVLITAGHQVKVMDLGVARLQDEALRLSQTGAFVGSIHYAAPECFREGGKHVDGRADLHALGLVLYELACGVNPYLADDVAQVLRRVLHDEPRRVGDVNPQLSPFFEEVVHTLLAKDPAERFADANALLAALEDGEKSAWWTSRAKSLREETKRPLRRVRIPRETAVYGRDVELTKLRALFEKAKAGDGQVVLIEGEAGIGKSRLVDELVGRLQRDGEDLNFLFGGYPPGGAATAAGAFSTAFREQCGDSGVGGYLPQTPLLVPAFEALLRGDATPSGCEALTKDSIATCFVQALRALAAERPTVLLIDDLHFASEDSRVLFTSLALAAPGHRIALVGTTRPGIDERWLAGLTRLPQASRMTVQRLGPKDLMALLRDSFRSDALATELAGQIATKSDGNPFFAFEIIRGLREGQFITQRDDGTWVSTGVIEDIKIPSSVLDLVNARVADLGEDERALLDVAACWGYEFDPGLVGEVLGLARIPALRSFGQVERLHRLVRSSGRQYVFDHHQVQEALYGSLNEQLREEYHAALASALEARTKAAERDPEEIDGPVCVDLCEHFLKGARGVSAVRYLRAAQLHLTRGSLHAQSVALGERALAVPGLLMGLDRAKALLRIAGVNAPLDLLGRRARQEECAREILRLAEDLSDDELRSHAEIAHGWICFRNSRHAEAEAAFRRALELARARGDRQTEAHATGNLGSVFLSSGRVVAARAQYERHLALAREIGDRTGEATARGNLGSAFLQLDRYPEAQAHYERALALARELGDRRGEVLATGNVAAVLAALGRDAEALTWGERHLALAREIGDRPAESLASGSLGRVLGALGRLAEAQGHFERRFALAREIGDRRGEAAAVADSAGAFLSLGRFAEARAQYERCLAHARENGDPHGESSTLVNLGLAALSLGDIAAARRDLAACLALSRELGARLPEGFALHGLALVADEECVRADALRLAEESLALRRELGHGGLVAESLVQVADLRRRAGDAAGARAAAEEGLSLSREPGREVWAAWCLAILANVPGGDAKAAASSATSAAALAERGEAAVEPVTRFLLWQATGDRAHLAQAKRHLDDLLARNPPELHETMRSNVRVNREILEACREAGL